MSRITFQKETVKQLGSWHFPLPFFPAKARSLEQEAMARLRWGRRIRQNEALTPNESEFTISEETVAGLCECLLTPKAGANLEAGKAMLRRKIGEVQAQLTERSNQ